MTADHAALEAIESAAFADLYRAAPDAIRASLDLDVAAVGGATCLRCAQLHPAAIFRRVCGLGVETPVREADLEAVLRHMDELTEQYAVTVTPHVQPAELASWLDLRGFA